jgi:hypothetical protein
MTGYLDLNLDTIVDQEIPGKIVITRATIDKLAIEFWFIGDEPLPGGGLPILHCFK